jgi:uncharacterized alpha-E superfamily protein
VEGTAAALEHFQWTAILKSVSGWEAYRKVDLEGISGGGIVRFLLFDARFPRSLRYALSVSANQFEQATEKTPAYRRTPVLREYGDLANKVRYDDLEEVLRAGIHAYVDDLQRGIGRIGDAMRAYVFEYIPDRV